MRTPAKLAMKLYGEHRPDDTHQKLMSDALRRIETLEAGLDEIWQGTSEDVNDDQVMWIRLACKALLEPPTESKDKE